ncbi:purine-cytosine permease family protein [Lutispora saccharofermentans]|uniref:Cytosine permease n=1 Tax=Lutispora saccharofermentans TaxID=3024236 RepID=A0ABT1NJ25_9FIRM|nr:cytosine permease [Lutispora saccharofermentans]MCQ1531278.1 cytosine permease [Lutispora saccharofermentans]
MSNFIDNLTDFLDRGEDYPREPVPQAARKPWQSIAMVWTGIYISMAAILDGLAIIGGLSFKNSLIALFTGFVIFIALTALQGSIGTETGLSTYIVAKQSFGLNGSHVVSIISFIVNFGWYAINVRALSESVVIILGKGNVNVISFILGVIMMITATVGYKGIEMLSTPTVIYTFLFMVVSTVRVFLHEHIVLSEVISRAPLGESMNLATGISILVGAMAAGAVNAPDVMRFSRKTSDNFKGLYLIGMPLAIIQPITAIFLGLFVGSSDFPTVMMSIGGFWGLLMIILGAWTSNDNALYSASLALSEIFPKVKRWKLAIGLGVGASGLASLINLGMYTNMMLLMGSFLVPILGITISDFFVLPKFNLERGLSLKHNEKANNAAIITWIVGGIFEAGLDFGYIQSPLGLPSVVATMILSLVLYLIIMKIKYRRQITAVQ